MLLTVQRNSSNLDACVAACWSNAAGGNRCKSVNYIKPKQICELMTDVLDVTNAQSIKSSAVADPSSTYAVLLSCQYQ